MRFSFCSSWGLSPAGCKQSLPQASDFLRHPGKVSCVRSAKSFLSSTFNKTENRQTHMFGWSLSLLPQVQLAAFLSRTELCNKSSPLLSKVWTGSWRVTVSEGACKHLYITAGNLTCPAELPARVSRGAVYLDKWCCSHCKDVISYQELSRCSPEPLHSVLPSPSMFYYWKTLAEGNSSGCDKKEQESQCKVSELCTSNVLLTISVQLVCKLWQHCYLAFHWFTQDLG